LEYQEQEVESDSRLYPRQFQTAGIAMTEERKFAILFAATILSAWRLIDMDPNKPNMAKGLFVTGPSMMLCSSSNESMRDGLRF